MARRRVRGTELARELGITPQGLVGHVNRGNIKPARKLVNDAGGYLFTVAEAERFRRWRAAQLARRAASGVLRQALRELRQAETSEANA